MNQPNNFNPNNFNPNYNPNYKPMGYPYGYMGQQPYMYGNTPQNMPQNQAVQSVNTYAYVNGLEGAKGFAMNPNQTILLMDSDSPMFYLKTSNAMGQSNLKAYKFEEVSLDNPTSNNNVDYVTKKDFEEFKKSMENSYMKKPVKKESE